MQTIHWTVRKTQDCIEATSSLGCIRYYAHSGYAELRRGDAWYMTPTASAALFQSDRALSALWAKHRHKLDMKRSV